MSSRSRTETIPASGEINLGPANFFFLLDTSAAVDVLFYQRGTNYGAEDIEAGYLKRNVDAWRAAKIVGTAGTIVEFFYGDEDVREDETDYRRTVGVYRPEQPETINDAVDVVIGAGATLILGTNAARRKATVRNLGASTGTIRVGAATVTTTRGVELAPGESQTFEHTGEIYGIQDGSGAASVCVNWENY